MAPRKKKYYSKKNTDRKQWKAINKINRRLDEKRCYDPGALTTVSGVYWSTTTANIATCLNENIAQGDGRKERLANKINVRRIYIKGHLKNNRGTPEDTFVRIMVTRMKMNMETDLDITEVLEDTASSSEGLLSAYNWNESGGYQILYDETFVMDTTQHTFIPFEISLKPKKRTSWPAKYNDGLTGTAAMTQGPIHIVYFSHHTADTNAPVLVFSHRIVFDA